MNCIDQETTKTTDPTEDFSPMEAKLVAIAKDTCTAQTATSDVLHKVLDILESVCPLFAGCPETPDDVDDWIRPIVLLDGEADLLAVPILKLHARAMFAVQATAEVGRDLEAIGNAIERRAAISNG